MGRTRKIVQETSESSSSSSSMESSEEESDGASVTPVLGSSGIGKPVSPLLQSYANLPTVNSFDQAQSFAQAKADTELAVSQAQDRLAALQANTLVYQTQVAPKVNKAQSSGPPLKTNDRTVLPVVSLPDYLIPKKTQPVSVHYSSKDKPKKRSHKSSKLQKKSEKRSASKKKSSRKSHKKAKRFSSESDSGSSSSDSSASEDEVEKQV